jgi:hypothetical protein
MIGSWVVSAQFPQTDTPDAHSSVESLSSDHEAQERSGYDTIAARSEQCYAIKSGTGRPTDWAELPSTRGCTVLLAQVWAGRQLYRLYFLMDFSKYLVVFEGAFLSY